MNQPAFDDWCEVFLAKANQTGEGHELQVQFPAFTVTIMASDLSFVQRILDFVSATKDNPEFRDIRREDGGHWHMPEKFVDLSSSFGTGTFTLQKDGEYDDSYILRMASPSGLSLMIDLRGKQLNAFIESLSEAL